MDGTPIATRIGDRIIRAVGVHAGDDGAQCPRIDATRFLLRSTEFAAVEAQSQSPGLDAKYYFLIRRLHSLCGLIPVGVFLCFHLVANSAILWPGQPGAEFQKAIDRLHGALGPMLVPVEIVGIFIPLFFHAILGVKIWLSSSPNASSYTHGPNIRFTLQRITGVFAFVFILYHVWHMHWFGKPLGAGHFELHTKAGEPAAAVTTATAIQAAWWIAPIYFLGVVASVFHLANGIWTMLITWGITIRPASQRVSGYVCAVFGVVLALVGIGALSGFRTFNVDATASSGHGVTAATHAP